MVAAPEIVNPFPKDTPLIPESDILKSLQKVEDGVLSSMEKTISREFSLYLKSVRTALKRKDVLSIHQSTWTMAKTLEEPMMGAWKLGWKAGTKDMVREMEAGYDPKSMRTFAKKKKESPLEGLLVGVQEDSIGFTNTAAERTILRRIQQLSGNFSQSQLGNLKVLLIASISPDKDGKVLSRKELESKIGNLLQVANARAKAIARTETTNAYNTSRIETALRNKGLITHLRFLAILDKRTTTICKSRNGMLIPVENSEAISANSPALHVNCRSVLSPVMAEFNAEHAKWAEDEKRSYEYMRKKVVPLSPGWNQIVVPPVQLVQEVETKVEEPEKPKLKDYSKIDRSDYKALISAGKEYFESVTKDLDPEYTNIYSVLKSSMAREYGEKLAKAYVDLIDIDEDVFKWHPRIRTDLTEFVELFGMPSTLKKISVDLDDDRAYANEKKRLIGMGGTDQRVFEESPDFWQAKMLEASKTTLFHEAGHHFEFSTRDDQGVKLVEKANNDWMRSKATSLTPEPLWILTGNTDYDDDEIALPGNFISPYVAKVYEDGATEVTSMGMERFSNTKGMRILHEKDEDHFYLIIGQAVSKKEPNED